MATPISKRVEWTPKCKYYLTTRGLNDKGQILCLETLPEWFHKFVTVVTVLENAPAVKKRYPLVSVWANPAHINSAMLKRKWVIENAIEGRVFLLNDEIKMYVVKTSGGVGSARDNPEDFRFQLKRLEGLTTYYAGVSIHAKLFSQEIVKSQEKIKRNYLPGLLFHWNRNLMLGKLELGRVVVSDFTDYLMQTLKLGYRTANFAGILYEPRASTMQRKHADRGVSVQEQSARKLIELHPESITWREDFDADKGHIMAFKARPSAAYCPTRRYLVLVDKEVPMAMAAMVVIMRSRKRVEVWLCSTDDRTSVSDPKAEEFLEERGYPCYGFDVRTLRKQLINKADHIVVFKKDWGMASGIDPRKLLRLELTGKLTEECPVAIEAAVEDAQVARPTKVKTLFQ